MGRPAFPPPRSVPELAAMAVHVIVRDYPETLAIFRRFAVDVPGRGGDPVARAVPGDPAGLLDALAAATAWRGEA